MADNMAAHIRECWETVYTIEQRKRAKVFLNFRDSPNWKQTH
jgi:hypothetical protein